MLTNDDVSDPQPHGLAMASSQNGEPLPATPRTWVRPVCPITQPPPKTLGEALERVKKQEPPHPYGDQVACALKRMAEVIGKPPARISTEPSSLRQSIATALPAGEEISHKRWRRICSLVVTYLRTTGIELEPGRNIAGHSDAWRDLLGRAEKNVRLATSRFASYCTREGVEPEEVTPATLAAFSEAMRERSFREKPETIVRNTITQWNRAVCTVEGWPSLSFAQQRHARYYSAPLSAYPESFRKDVDDFLAPRTGVSIFSKDYRRPIRKSTHALRLRQLRVCAALLVESGFPAEQLTSLAVLVEPDNVAAALQRHIDRKDGETTHSVVQLASLLARIGERRLRDPEQLATLRTFAANAAKSRLEQRGQIGLTDRNKAALRQFDVAANRKALLTLPERVFDALQSASTPTPALARRAMLALAVELLLATALRGGNLTALEIDRHFTEIRNGREAVRYLLIPAAEMKGKEVFEVPLPDRTRDLLEEYLTTYWPILAPEGSAYLFPGRGERVRDSIHFAQAITDFVLRETGIKMHLHLFRHFAIKLHFNAHPDDVETARRFLQHKSSRTTLTHYTEARADRAFAIHHQTLEAERNKGGERHASRR